MKVAVPWLQHSQRFGHCALSQTVCNRKSEISALVEKKTGFDGSRTLIHGGFCAWCRAGSIFAQDISKSYKVQNVTKVKSRGGAHCAASRSDTEATTWFVQTKLRTTLIHPPIPGRRRLGSRGRYG